MLQKTKKMKPNSWQIIAMSYLAVILIGSFLLSLPISSKTRMWTNFLDAIFTSTSATCVTGLIKFDTFSHWSLFGQVIILLLVQIGGIGFMTILSIFFVLTKKQIGLYERLILNNSTRTINFGGIVKLVKRIVVATLIFELLGTILLSIKFIPLWGGAKGIYFALFHSISAFCNAGFDLMGIKSQFSSMAYFQTDILVNMTLMMLIIIGGLGFLVWNDLWDSKFNFKKLQWHTKIVLVATSLFIIIPSLLFVLLEMNNAFADMSGDKAVLSALFLAIAPRTAGFSALPITSLSNGSVLLTMLLMFVGGSSGSTAGGIKITTFVVIVFALKNLVSTSGVNIGKKRLQESTIKQAFAVVICYIIAIFLATLTISIIEPFSIKDIAFEVFSAINTVGLSMGITPYLSTFSQMIIAFLMYIGRVGLITVVLSFAQKSNPSIQRPIGEILIG